MFYSSRLEGMRQLSRLVRSDECSLESLSLSDSKLKELTPGLLHSLTNNESLRKLDIRLEDIKSTNVKSLHVLHRL